jgi:hypothetical protein
MRIPSHLTIVGQIADQSDKHQRIATDDFFRKDNLQKVVNLFDETNGGRVR